MSDTCDASYPNVPWAKIRVREVSAPLTRNCGGPGQGSLGQELFDDLVSAAALTGDDQAGKVEFQSGLDFTRRNVLDARRAQVSPAATGQRKGIVRCGAC